MEFPAPSVNRQVILVTGSSGSIGKEVCRRLTDLGAEVREFDLALGWDLTNPDDCQEALASSQPSAIVHLAAHKFATSAEGCPADVATLNIQGTQNLCEQAKKAGVESFVFASTCKAIQPETVYGASKLVGERIALNHGFTVGRFFNVIESSGNVFAIWRNQIARGEPLEVTQCQRYFISIREATSFITHLLDAEPGRYAPFPGGPFLMTEMASRFAPNHPVVATPPRRGDRLVEPLVGTHESYDLVDRLMCITNPHDPPSDPGGDALTKVTFPPDP
jgi:FlaA1/EpsC-like NDP-sugar epimerase